MKRLILAITILPMALIACNRSGSGEPQIAEITLNNIDAKKGTGTGIADMESLASAADNTKGIVAFSAPRQVTPNVESQEVQSPVSMDWDKKIIKTGNVRLEVKSYDNYFAKIRTTIKKYGGYIAKEDNFNTDEKTEAILCIKVPVQFFESLMNELPAEDAEQLERGITTEDVTGQLIDTRARMETKKVTRGKYLEFLKQSNKMEDILKVQSEINNIQEDIESAESRLQHLTHESRYSTINLTFFEPKAGYAQGGEPGYASRIAQAFASGGKWFADLLVGIISIWPLWLAGLLAFILFKKWSKPAVLIKK